MVVNGQQEPDRPRWASPALLRTAALWVIVLAGSWWLLSELAAVLRPLLVAVFLGYILMPYYSRLRQRLPAPVAITLIAGATTAVLVGLAFAVYASLLDLSRELTNLQQQVGALVRDVTSWAASLPVIGPILRPAQQTDEQVANRVAGLATQGVFQTLNVAGGAMLEAAAAGLYLLFLLLESTYFPDRVRAAYEPERAEHILHVFGRINGAIISYLKAKVKSSLVLAIPVGLVLAVLGVKFWLLWAVVTFLCNFIPYIGSVVGYSLPAAFAFVQFGMRWEPITTAAILLAIHVGFATVFEPMILGRAIGLSPLVILAALSVWGLLWGLPGMVLAVPLTVVLKIVFENLDATRSLALLLSGKEPGPKVTEE
jgi:AI-2 transport protein TqsA